MRLYTWDSPNAEKVHLAVEELGLEVEFSFVDLQRGAQREASFLEVSPTGQVPVLVDGEGTAGEVRVFDSAAILLYLAEKTGRLLPREPGPKAEVLSWLMFQGAQVGPVFGLFHQCFQGEDTAVPAVLRLLRGRVLRAYETVERGLASRPFIAGELSIADLGLYPWLRAPERMGVDREALPLVAAWLERMGARDPVKQAIERLETMCRSA